MALAHCGCLSDSQYYLGDAYSKERTVRLEPGETDWALCLSPSSKGQEGPNYHGLSGSLAASSKIAVPGLKNAFIPCAAWS